MSISQSESTYDILKDFKGTPEELWELKQKDMNKYCFECIHKGIFGYVSSITLHNCTVDELALIVQINPYNIIPLIAYLDLQDINSKICELINRILSLNSNIHLSQLKQSIIYSAFSFRDTHIGMILTRKIYDLLVGPIVCFKFHRDGSDEDHYLDNKKMLMNKYIRKIILVDLLSKVRAKSPLNVIRKSAIYDKNIFRIISTLSCR